MRFLRVSCPLWKWIRRSSSRMSSLVRRLPARGIRGDETGQHNVSSKAVRRFGARRRSSRTTAQRLVGSPCHSVIWRRTCGWSHLQFGMNRRRQSASLCPQIDFDTERATKSVRFLALNTVLHASVHGSLLPDQNDEVTQEKEKHRQDLLDRRCHAFHLSAQSRR